MDLLLGIWDTVVPFLIILTLLVFVHELGHYLVARRNGVGIEAFSIGFGPELFGWYDKAGTRWKFSAIPLGGYVKMVGDADPASATQEDEGAMSDQELARSFHNKSLGARTAVVAAGPAANFLFAIVLLAGVYATVGKQVPVEVPEGVVQLGTILPDGAAADAGLEPGDIVLSVEGTPVGSFAVLRDIVRSSPSKPLALEIDRNGETLKRSIVPSAVTEAQPDGSEVQVGRIGVHNLLVETKSFGVFASVLEAVKDTGSITVQTLDAVGEIIAGARTAEELGGPIRIAQMSGTVAESGLETTIIFMAILSINLGLINLFPIPVLDGGHLMFYAIEAIQRRPMSERVREFASLAGLTMVIALMLFVTWNDLAQLQVFDYLGSLFTS